MSVGNNVRFNEQQVQKQPRVFLEEQRSRVNLSTLMERARVEKKKIDRNNLVISLAAISAAAVLGIILTL
jgi:hypothetical protein|tara:strand:- start:147 stop:356 length:210 start_codon:yes stop_codon:yes gene_type:complete